MSTLILCFHRIAEPEHGGRSRLAISPADFERVLDDLAQTHDFVALAEALIPSRSRRAIVTFDDGYADNFHTAWPILENRGIPASFFVSTGYVERQNLFLPDSADLYFSQMASGQHQDLPSPLFEGGYWSFLEKAFTSPENDFWTIVASLSKKTRELALGTDSFRRPMTIDELSEFSRIPGVTIGPHSVSHRRFSGIDLRDAVEEVRLSRNWLLTQGIEPIPYFAYPFGQQRDFTSALSRSIQEQGMAPLTTLPLAFRATRFSEGIPRLSIGPAEIARWCYLPSLIELMSLFPRIWLSTLEFRRQISLI